jgi:hypothetical protein
MLKAADIHDATHVMARDGSVERIKAKHGVGPGRSLAPPSKGWFSVTTYSGRVVHALDALRYFKEERED